MSTGDFSRRDIIKTGVTAAAVAGVPLWFSKRAEAFELDMAAAKPKKIGPNDKIRIGAIGLGGSKGGYRQGTGDTNAARNKEETEIVAVCDLDRVHRMEAEERFKCEGYHDYRDLLERDDIDAVIIATLLIIGTSSTSTAATRMDAGKDVYCEKPLTHGAKRRPKEDC